jgi:hypothetical protein
MPTKISTLKDTVKLNIKTKISDLKIELDNNKKEAKKINQKNSGWKTPFVILFLLIIGSLIGAYSFYRNLVKKMHLP